MKEKETSDGRLPSRDQRKKPYSTPRLTEWGTVVDMTNDLGKSRTTDAMMTGSMASPAG